MTGTRRRHRWSSFGGGKEGEGGGGGEKKEYTCTGSGVKKGLEQATRFYRLLITSHRFSQRVGCMESPRLVCLPSLQSLL